MVADGTLHTPHVHNIQVRGNDRVSGTTIDNVHPQDAGQQLIKVITINLGSETQGGFVAPDRIACALMEQAWARDKGVLLSESPENSDGELRLADGMFDARAYEFSRLTAATDRAPVPFHQPSENT